LGLRPSTAETFEAGAWHGRGFLEGTVAVRLHDLEGRPLGYAGRRLDPEAVTRHGKWKMPPGLPKGSLLYGWHRARSHLSTGLVVVEGAWSVMKLWQAGIPNAVALLGTVVTPRHVSLFAQARTVALFLDADAAGDRATEHACRQRIHHNLRIVRGPTGTDPADLPETQLMDLLAGVLAFRTPR
jgi:DNA primase